MKNIFQSKLFVQIITAVGILLVALLILNAGIAIGRHREAFSYRWGEQYHRNFGGPREGFMPRFDKPGMMGMPNPHGTFGKVIAVSLPTFSVQSVEGIEKAISIGDDTIISGMRGQATSTDIKVGDNVVVIGEPNEQGQIVAKLIRMMPPVPMMGASATPMGAPATY